MLKLKKILKAVRGASVDAMRAALLVSVLVMLFAGCSTPKQLTDPIIGPSYVPSNYFRRTDILPLSLQRVAVLPMTFSASASSAEPVEDLLQSALVSELNKAGKFELLMVSPDQVQQWTGKTRWNFQEALPHDFLQKIQANTGSDGVLFVHLASYHAYRPIVIGWRMHLVNAAGGDVLWSVDETFDAGEETVSNAARRYSREHLRNHPTLEESRSILLAPRRFAQYTLAAVVGTLPAR